MDVSHRHLPATSFLPGHFPDLHFCEICSINSKNLGKIFATLQKLITIQ